MLIIACLLYFSICSDPFTLITTVFKHSSPLSFYTDLGSDYVLSTTLVTVRDNAPTDVRVIYRVDSVAQEDNETATLQLQVVGGNVPDGGIFDDELSLTIFDSDGET